MKKSQGGSNDRQKEEEGEGYKVMLINRKIEIYITLKLRFFQRTAKIKWRDILSKLNRK